MKQHMHINTAALAALLLADLVCVCLAESEPLEPPPVTIDPGSDTEVIEELPNADAEVPPEAPTVVPYSCTGQTCCNFTCDDEDDSEFTCVRSADAGFFVPDFWVAEFGFESCSMKVSDNYNISIPCSQALPPQSECGLPDSHACGYGLVCAAKEIGFAQCLPVCGSEYPQGLLTLALGEFYLQKITMGCTDDGAKNEDGAHPSFSVLRRY